jgi:MFS transporter, ACS family, tartrate transporter
MLPLIPAASYRILARAGIASGRVGTAVAIPYAVAAIAMWWWPRRSDRLQERVRHIAVASVAAFMGLAGSACLKNSPLLSVAAISIGAAGTLAIIPIFWTLPAAILRGAAAGGAIALINAIGNVGGFAGPFLIGWIKDASGSFTWGVGGGRLQRPDDGYHCSADRTRSSGKID